MQTDEIYDVLMEQFLKAAAKYDPQYGHKLRRVVEVINALSNAGNFGALDADGFLEFSSDRFLRMHCRRGFLVAQPEKGQTAGCDRTATCTTQ